MRKIMKFWCVALALAFAMPVQAQWSEDPKENKQLMNERFLESEIVHLKDGSFYLFYNQFSNNEESDLQINPFLQYYNKNGNPVWEHPIQLADEPTMSYTKVMQHLLSDDDGNVVVAVQNMKKGKGETYTLYKVDKTGKMLWGEAGIDMVDGETSGYPGALNMIQLPDGGYLCAWTEVVDVFNNIFLQKITKDGKRLWGAGKDLGNGSFPYLVDAGDGDVIVVYSYGKIKARKLDFAGNDVWNGETVVFDGSLPDNIPVWTYIDVVPANGGAIVGFYAFDGTSDRHATLCWIKGDGRHAFPDAEVGLRLDWAGNWAFQPKLAYDAKEEVVYAVWRENSPGTNFISRIVSQKIGSDGTLHWGAEGVELIPLKQRAVDGYTASLGPDGTVLFAIMEHAGQGIAANDPIEVRAALLQSDGNFAWEQSRIISNAESSKTDLYCSSYIDGNWFLIWKDCRLKNSGVSDGVLFGQNVRLDGTLGGNFSSGTAYEQSVSVFAEIRIVPNPVSDHTNIHVASETYNGPVSIALFDMNGRKVTTLWQGMLQVGSKTIEWLRPSYLVPGIYMVEIKAGEQTVRAKMLLR